MEPRGDKKDQSGLGDTNCETNSNVQDEVRKENELCSPREGCLCDTCEESDLLVIGSSNMWNNLEDIDEKISDDDDSQSRKEGKSFSFYCHLCKTCLSGQKSNMEEHLARIHSKAKEDTENIDEVTKDDKEEGDLDSEDTQTRRKELFTEATDNIDNETKDNEEKEDLDNEDTQARRKEQFKKRYKVVLGENGQNIIIPMLITKHKVMCGEARDRKMKKTDHEEENEEERFIPSNNTRNVVGPIKSHKCDLCGKVATTSFNLKNHTKTAHDDNEAKCNSCEKVMKNAFGLQYHVVHDATQAKCDLCQKVARNAGFLGIHKKNAHATKEFKCDLCQKVLSSRPSLWQHKKNVHADGKVIRKQDETDLQSHVNRRPNEQNIAVPLLTKQNVICGEGRNDRKEDERISLPALHDRSLKCDLCGKVATTPSNLQSHKRMVHDTKSVKCDLCEKITKNAFALQMHTNHVHPAERQKCDLCDKVLKNAETLKSHVTSVHATEKLKCDVCDKELKNATCLYIHKRNVHAALKVKCDLCETVLKNARSLLSHKRHVHSTHRVNCDLCKKVLGNARLLERHKQKVHVTEKIKCDVCEKESKNAVYLRIHKRYVHAVEKVKCDLCETVLKNARTLLSHKKHVHSTHRVNCDLCRKVLRNAKLLERHKQKVHVTEKIKCDVCEKKLKNATYLYIHKRSVHATKTVKCDACDTVLSSAHCLRRHQRNVHSAKALNCDYCQKIFKNMPTLHQHKRRNHATSSITCQRCKSTFQNEMTMTTHMDDCSKEVKHFKCPQCDYTLSTKNSVARHIRSVHDKFSEGICQFCGKSFIRRKELSLHIKKAHKEEEDKEEEEVIDEEGKTIFPCHTCGQVCESRQAKSRHMIIAHGTKTNKSESAASKKSCAQCGYESISAYSINTHVRAVHDKLKDHGCQFCDQRFSFSSSLRLHLKKKHQGGKEQEFVMTCELCGWRGSSVGILSMHMSSDHGFNKSKRKKRNAHKKEEEKKDEEVIDDKGKTIFPCQTCGQVLLSNRARISHVVNEHGEKKKSGEKENRTGGKTSEGFKCSQCDYTTARRSSIIRHVRSVHDNVKEGFCQFCGKGYVSTRNLRLHVENVHKEEEVRDERGRRIFPCETCGQVCESKRIRTVHMVKAHGVQMKKKLEKSRISHVVNEHGEKKTIKKRRRQENITGGETSEKFKCPQCDYTAARRSSIVRHVRSVHDNIKEGFCQFCGKGYVSVRNLRLHVENVHREEEVRDERGRRIFPCVSCGQVCASKRMRTVHMAKAHGVQMKKKLEKLERGENVVEQEGGGEEARVNEEQGLVDNKVS